MSLQHCYRKITGNFGDGGTFYGDDGHGGTDYYGDTGDPVLAYADGVIGYVGSPGWGGGVVGMKMDAGDYAGWAHLDPINVSVDQRVKAGDVIGHVAGRGQNHGYQWGGPHKHTTRSAKSSMAAALGHRPLMNPAPGIAEAIKGSAHGGPKGSDDMQVTLDKDRGHYYFTDEFGAQNIASYSSVDIGTAELIEAATAAFGLTTLTKRQSDIANALAQRRWESKRAELVAAVKSGINLDVAAIGKAASEAVTVALKQQGVKVDVDEAAIAAEVVQSISKKLAK